MISTINGEMKATSEKIRKQSYHEENKTRGKKNR
jgi:hypothetical protein